MKKNLDITNYDNFKDLSYFITQHKKALGMLDEIEKFYLAFLNSKVIRVKDIANYPGKVINKITYKTGEKSFSEDEPEYESIKVGAHIKNFTITKCKVEETWYKTYKDCYVRYDDDNPRHEYVLLFQSCDEIHIPYDNYKEKDYQNQLGIKKKIYRKLKEKYPNACFLVNQEGEFIYFCNEEDMSKYKFMLSDDYKHLIVYEDTFKGGTETDKWKTYSYEGYTRKSFIFDVNTGNFLKRDKKFIYTSRIELRGVHNGWHPYMDD